MRGAFCTYLGKISSTFSCFKSFDTGNFIVVGPMRVGATVQIEDNITQILPRFKLSAKISKKLSVHKTMYVIFFFSYFTLDKQHSRISSIELLIVLFKDGWKFNETASNIDQRHPPNHFRTKFPVFSFFAILLNLLSNFEIHFFLSVLRPFQPRITSTFPSKRESINHPSFSTHSRCIRTVARGSSNSSQDLVLDEECVNDHPQDQSNDHRNEKDGLEKMPRALHPWFCSACPTLASTVFARNASWLHRRRSCHVAG